MFIKESTIANIGNSMIFAIGVKKSSGIIGGYGLMKDPLKDEKTLEAHFIIENKS